MSIHVPMVVVNLLIESEHIWYLFYPTRYS